MIEKVLGEDVQWQKATNVADNLTNVTDKLADSLDGVGDGARNAANGSKEAGKGLGKAAKEAKKTAKEAEQAGIEVEKLYKTFQVQTYVADKLALAMDKLNYQLEKQQTNTQKYATWALIS